MKNSPQKLAMLLLAFFVSAAVSYEAITRGIADEHGEAGRIIMAGWTSFIPKESWLKALDEIDLALKYDAGDGANHYRRARLYHLCVVYLVDCDLPKVEAVKISSISYQVSRDIRPMWTRGIAHYALLKRDVGQLDQSFYELVESSVSLGPRVPQTLRLISQIALTRWQAFDEGQQLMLAQHLVRGLESPSKGVKKAIIEQLHKSRREVGGAMIASILEYLNRNIESTEWDADFVDLTFLFWSKWPVSERLDLINRLNLLATSTRVNHVLQIAGDNNKLLIACAILVQTKAVINACNNKSMSRSFNK
jgi:hypothetical protein